MLFNSITFLIFLLIVFSSYWIIGSKRRSFQNILLLISSYVFYGWWDWRFLSLIFLSSIVDYSVGMKLENTNKSSHRKWVLACSMIFNLGLLGYFKYYNFFIDSFSDLLETLGLQANIASLNIILPVGISFYTFQTMSYSIDIYRKELKHSKDIISFMAFVSFFPQLVAGPIERAKNLLPQFSKERSFDYPNAIRGLEQILWGFFKKVVVADNLATYVNGIFASSDHLPSSVLIIGAVLFTFQVYGDFSGYSDIAIGTARLFGFRLMDNFRYPYFASSVQDFWHRWHISLYTWFNDYLFLPLAIVWRNLGKAGVIMALLSSFLFSGLWHGSNWKFAIFGWFHGSAIALEMITKKTRRSVYKKLPKVFQPILGGFFTLLFIEFTFIIFRARNFSEALTYIKRIFINESYLLENLYYLHPSKVVFPIIILLIFELANRKQVFGLDLGTKPRPVRWALYHLVFLLIFFLGSFNESSFIYFQF